MEELGTREERLVCVPQGDVKYTLLLEDVQAQYRRPGDHHWGTQFDVNNLSEALDIGILMFCDNLQSNGQTCLYNVGAQREDFPYLDGAVVARANAFSCGDRVVWKG